MKRVRWLLLILPVLALFGAFYWHWKTRQPDYVLRQFIAQEEEDMFMVHRAPTHLALLEAWQKSRVYPQKPPYLEPVESDFLKPFPTWLWMTWYPSNISMIDWTVDLKGGISCQPLTRHLYGTVIGATNKMSLSDMNRLKKLLLQFPHCVSPAPNAENVLLISYRNDNSWQARVCDRRSLPSPVRELLKLPTLQASIDGLQGNEKPDLAH